MKKSELRKLRSLPPTKEMIEKARDNKIHEKVKGIGYDAYYQKRYRYFARVQNLGYYIKMAIYEAENLAAGIKTPKFEVFLNPKGEEYTTRILKDDGTEDGWSKAMLYNIPGMEGYYWYSYKYQHTFWLNRDATRTLKGLMKDKGPKRQYRNEADAIACLRDWQQSLKEKERDAREAREVAPWDADMQLIPKEPKDFDEWLKYTVPTVEYGIYKAGEKTTFCTHCTKEVDLQANIKAVTMKCPVCKRELKIVQGERYKNHFEEINKTTQLLQPIKGGYVVREFFSSRRIHPKKRTVTLYKHETKRTLWINGKVKTYMWSLYKNRVQRWCYCGSEHYYWGWHSDVIIYKKNMAQLAKAVGSGTALPQAIKAGMKISATKYIHAEQENPAVEKLVKVNLVNMAEELIEERYDIELLNQDATELTKMLKIDKMRLKRLQGLENPGLTCLRWMQEEKKANTVWPDETIKWFENIDESPTSLAFKPKKMGLVEFRNYIEKQTMLEEMARNTIKNRQGWYRACEDTVGTYRDYLNMASKLKMRTDIEQIYKPKNLRAAHDEAVEAMNTGQMKKTAADIAKKFKKVEKNLKDLTKYEYEDGNYLIKAPRDIFDIVREGTILHHCIHTCDYYFERITTKESFILFLRLKSAPESPWYTLEIEPGGNIRQKRTTGDKQGEDLEKAIPFLKKYQKQLKKKLTAEDKKLAEAADVKRKKNYKTMREEKKRVWHGIHQGELLADVLEADFMAAI